jgi:multisubunit Na+/H+ antiporter MnhB subunit
VPFSLPWQWLADGVLALHTAFVAFVVAGLALILLGLWRGWAWVRNRRFRQLHLAAIGIVVLQAWLGASCPLTVLENHLRMRAGQAGYTTSFIQDWLWRILYWDAPGWVFTLVYTAFGALVALAWWLCRPRPPGSG